MRWANEGEAGVGGGEGGGATRFAGEPTGQEAEAAGPTSSDGLKDKGSEEEPCASTPGRGVVEEGFARLGMLKHRARVPVGLGPNGGAEGAADGEVPSPGQTRGGV